MTRKRTAGSALLRLPADPAQYTKAWRQEFERVLAAKA